MNGGKTNNLNSLPGSYGAPHFNWKEEIVGIHTGDNGDVIN